ncbi:MAG TPA: tetratricopeptide repeat protein, partial [Thioploca sp.]|nr:tetratricopeptide repeat protein [Thioploca sp.]
MKQRAYVTLLGLLLAQMVFATESRLSLTASDGSGLELQQFKAKVVLDGFLAFTELEMVFYNPENRQREGRFQIILPDNAAISRFAMKIGERLQEGEVVEKQLARRAYEDFLHRRQDPALLEMDSGNRFNARIFPIAPKSEKHLILSYSQRLAGENSEYVLPLNGLPRLKQLAIKVFYDGNNFSTAQLGELSPTVSQREVLTIDKRDYQPTVDFRMPYQAARKNLAMQSEQLVAARIVPFTDDSANQAQQNVDNLIVLVDTSASQAPYLPDSLNRLATLLPQLKVGTLQLYAFDQTIREIGTADNLTAQVALIEQLKQHNALGASRFDAAIAALKALKLDKARLLLISDAVVTAGETSAAQLAVQLKTIAWLERVDILVPSYHSDKKIARSLAKAGQSPGIVAPLTLSDAELIRKLLSTVYADSPIKVSGSTWFWPEKVEALQTNEPLIVFAEIPQLPKGGTVRISVGGKELSLTTKPANPILLKREWVRARLDKLLDMEDQTQDTDMKSAFHNEIINLSVKDRVLSPYTSLLVLETENDYRRYNIDRRGLADILTVGVDGITVIKRAGVETPQPIPVPVPIPEEPVAIPKGVVIIDDNEEMAMEDAEEVAPTLRLRGGAGAGAGGADNDDDERYVMYRDILSAPPARMARPSASAESMPETVERRSRARNGSDGELAMMPSPSVRMNAPPPPPSPQPESRYESAPRGESVEMTEPLDADAIEIEAVVDMVDETRAAEMVPQTEVAPETMAEPEALVEEEREEEGVVTRTVQAITQFFGLESSESQEAAEREARQAEEARLRAELEARREAEAARLRAEMEARLRAAIQAQAERKKPQVPPWTGKYAKFRALLDKADLKAAGSLAQQWRQENLADVMALIALGEWYEKTGDTTQAARAYGSLVDYFPARADIRRWAAERLLSINAASELSIDSLKKAVTQRPDHPAGHYLLAIAYWEAEQYQEAVETLQAALERNYPRF